MGRHSRPIPDASKGKQLQHYVNGRDAKNGMHYGIRSKCSICAQTKTWEELSSREIIHIIDPDNDVIDPTDPFPEVQ